MKILYNLNSTFNSGGTERIVIAKINALAEMGYELTLVTTDQKGKDSFYEINKNVVTIDLAINYSNNNNNFIKKVVQYPLKKIKHLNRLKKVINNINPDIIISTFGNESNLIPQISTQAKIILEAHFSKYFRFREYRKGIWKIVDIIRCKQEEHITKLYDKFIVLTNEDKLSWGEQPNIEVIPNFINENNLSPANLDNKKCIAVGRLSYIKGFDRLIDIWNIVHHKHPDWSLHIYGSGELQNFLQEKIKESNLITTIEIHPPTNFIESAYIDSSIYLLTSYSEGLPMVLLESFSFGVPVISFDCKCGPKDIIENGKNGFIIKDGDLYSFADKITTLIENTDLRKQMGKNAYKTSFNYTKNSIMPIWIELFDKLLN